MRGVKRVGKQMASPASLVAQVLVAEVTSQGECVAALFRQADGVEMLERVLRST
jgi:hypothetical protein